MKNIIIFVASGHGSVVLDCIEKEGKYNVVGFLDSFKKKGHRHCGYPILGNEFDLPYIVDKYSLKSGIVAVGDNWIRHLIVGKICKIFPDFDFISTVHPSAIVGKGVSIGIGTVIMPGSIVNANSNINDFCIINTFSSLDHDGIMEDFSSLAPRVCAGGNFTLGKFSAVCLGSNVIENITIAEHTVVGAGSLVVRNLGNHLVAYGTPAKKVRIRNVGEPYMFGSRAANLVFP